MALASAHRGEPLGGGGGPVGCFGEIGLTGELRYVAHPERRVAEALKFGLGPVIGPPAAESVKGLAPQTSVALALRAALRKPGATRPAKRPAAKAA
jgi:predicted ATP-dependent serine protease